MIVLDLLRAIGLMLSLMTTGLISAVLIVVLYPLLLIFDKDWVIPHRIVITSCWMVSKLWLTVEVKVSARAASRASGKVIDGLAIAVQHLRRIFSTAAFLLCIISRSCVSPFSPLTGP